MKLTKLAFLTAALVSNLASSALADPPAPPSAPTSPPAQPAVVPPPPPVPKPAPPPPTKAAASPTKDQPPPTTRIAANGILGRKVLGPDGQEIGRVVDVLVDAGSNPRAAVIDFGGFMGVGTRRIAIDWSDMIFPATGSGTDIKLDLTADQIRNAPAYTDQTKPASVVEPPTAKPAPPPAVVAKPAPPDLSARPTPGPPEILKPDTGH